MFPVKIFPNKPLHWRMVSTTRKARRHASVCGAWDSDWRWLAMVIYNDIYVSDILWDNSLITFFTALTPQLWWYETLLLTKPRILIHHIYRGILRIGSTPKSSIVFFWFDFPWNKLSSFWGTQIYGNPNIPNGTMVIFHSYHSYLDVYPS